MSATSPQLSRPWLFSARLLAQSVTSKRLRRRHGWSNEIRRFSRLLATTRSQMASYDRRCSKVRVDAGRFAHSGPPAVFDLHCILRAITKKFALCTEICIWVNLELFLVEFFELATLHSMVQECWYQTTNLRLCSSSLKKLFRVFYVGTNYFHFAAPMDTSVR